MKKSLLFLFVLATALFRLQAQTTITNGTFESWDNVGSATEEPTQWNSNKTGGGNATSGPQTCYRETSNPHSGSYCAKVMSGNVFGIVVNGSLTTGKVEAPSFTKSEGYIHTLAGTSNAAYHMNFTGRPDSIVFWYRYTPSGTDYPRLEARLHKDNAYAPEAPVNGNHPDSTVNIIARAVWTGSTSTVSSWTRVSMPFTYVDSRTPEYILITSTSSGDQTGGTSGSTLWLDDIDVVYNPVITTGTFNGGPYYVSAATGASVSVPFTLTGTFNAGNIVTAQLSNSAGSFSSPVSLGTSTTTSSGTVGGTIPANTATGTGYRIRTTSSNPALTSSGNNGSDISIVLVSNSIAPSSNQTIAVNTNGNQLTVTQTAGATGQEWKYSTTSGGPYSSFGTPQTGTTYTPNSPVTGTFYIVCVTTYPGGVVVTSNEVQINVVSNGIAPATTQNIGVGANGSVLTVTETPTALSREWLYGTSSGGPYTSFTPLQTGTTYTPNFNTAGTYYVVCNSAFTGLNLKSNEVQINVCTNSAAPSAVQYIRTNTNGTIITVTETPGATSREWRYATVSGGPYISFGTAQTGTSYTPNFSTAGGYYVVCVSNFSGFAVTSNETRINVVSTIVTPPAAQNTIATVDGNTLTVTETPVAGVRHWAYSTTPTGVATTIGGQTATTYTPNFNTPGTYYVMCITQYGGSLYDTSNRVQVNVGVENNVIPATSQSILVNVNGTMLTVIETPTGTSREWKYATSTGGPYSSFGTPQTGTTYTPNFSSAGTYYVVCVSVIDGLTATSNEVLISVGNATITTGAVNGSPFNFSPSAPDASVSVPYTTSGTFNGGNIFTAQLSDASGSFATPTNIGTLTSTTSGTISATIPHTTAAGAAYRIRVISSNPVILGSDNGTDLVIDQFNNSIAPTAVQYVAVSSNGSALTVTESQTATHNWKYSTTSGGGYVNFSPTQTGSTYTPNFAMPGTYYVVCVSTNQYSDNVTSNEVQVVVAGNSIAPSTTQNILVNVDGNTLTVTETPTALAHEWLYGTQSGGPYVSFTPLQTGSTYTPNFSTAGTYYVVCNSSFTGGINVRSNEVIINVANATITTGTISGSPFNFSPSAPDASVSVPYTTSGTFNAGNVFTAQLSNANGSFASPVNIGSVTSTTGGTISATIPHTTTAGTGYRIRVVSDNPVITGSDNGTDLVIDQFHNSVAPSTTQTIMYGTDGTALTVTASQNATQEWKYSTTSGSGYISFSTAQTGTTYTPHFATPGTYYVVCVSTNQYTDAVTSNEVEIDVQNGSTITTSAVTGSPYYVSASANNQVSVNFTSNVIFNGNNVFTAQLSDNTGSFASPVDIGTLSSSTVGAISAVIPNNTSGGTGYRIRVVSSNPAVTGSDNGTDLHVIPFEISLTPMDTQHLLPAQAGTTITASSTHTVTYQWQNSQSPGFGYTDFIPAQTGDTLKPQFPFEGPYYIICKMTNTWGDVATSQEVVVIVAANGIDEVASSTVKAYWNSNDFMLDLTAAKLEHPVLQLVDMKGQVVLNERVSSGTINTISTQLPEGIYVFRVIDAQKVYSAKTSKR